MMEACICCAAFPGPNGNLYLLTDLSDELVAMVDSKYKFQVTVNSYLCEQCFNFYYKIYTNCQEPELKDNTNRHLSSPDPLSALIIKNEEVSPNVKIENPCEGDIPEHNQMLDDKKPFVESEPLKEMLEDHEEKTDMKLSIDKSSESDVQTDTESEEECSHNGSKRMKIQMSPPLIQGSNRDGKCDWCRTSLRNQKYRRLPDGREKDFIAVKTFPRDKSPERVCDGCWNKAKSVINKEKTRIFKEKKENKSTDEEKPKTVDKVNTIKLQNYVVLPKTANKCLVPGCNGKERFFVPKYLKKVLLESHKVFAPYARLCRQHIKEYHRDWSIVDKARHRNEFTGEEVKLMLDFLREQALDMPD